MINIWIEVEMKKFELYSAAICKPEGIAFVKNTVKADSFADVIEYIESNAGWYTADNGAFKVAYIEEVVE